MSLSSRKGTINTAQPQPPIIATAFAAKPPLIGVGNHFRRSTTPPGRRHDGGTLHSCWGECQKIPSSFGSKLRLRAKKHENTLCRRVTAELQDGDLQGISDVIKQQLSSPLGIQETATSIYSCHKNAALYVGNYDQQGSNVTVTDPGAVCLEKKEHRPQIMR